jgi:hypothetical protein
MALEPAKTNTPSPDAPPAAAGTPAPEGPDTETSEFESEFAGFAGADKPESDNDGDGSQADPDKSQNKPKPGGTPAPGPAQTPSATPDQNVDNLWKDAPPVLRSAFEAERQRNQQLEHENRSHRGRFSRIIRQHPDIFKTEAPAQPAAPAPASAGASKPAAQPGALDGGGGEGQGTAPKKPDGTSSGVLGSAKWKEFTEEYPDVAGPIAEALEAGDARAGRLERELSFISTDRRQAHQDRQFGILVDAHPDWDKIYGTDHFEKWLGTQPDYVIQAAVRNAEAIVDGEEAAHIVSLFKASTGYAPANPQPTNQPANPPANPQPNGPGQGGAGSQQQPGARQRERRLNAGFSPPSKGAGAGSGPPDDFDSAFEHFAERQKA